MIELPVPMQYSGLVGLVVAFCAVAATALPPPKPDAPAWYVAVHKAINWVAMNWGHATNVPPPPQP